MPVAGEDASPAEPFGPYHLILDGVGGHMLASAAMLLAPKGMLLSYAAPSGNEIVFNSRVLNHAPGAVLTGFLIFRELAAEPAAQGLADLATLVEQGRLHPLIEAEVPWDQAPELARRLIERAFPGKGVLLIQ